MAKKKYKFNQETLSYERVGITFKDKATKILAYFSSSLAIALILVVVFINAYETPKTKALKRENQRLLTQYELMDKDLGEIAEDLQISRSKVLGLIKSLNEKMALTLGV